MFDPKKLGEEADEMIKNLNQQADDAGVTEEDIAAVEAEDQSEAVEAITEGEDAVVGDDQGVEQVSEEVVSTAPDVAAELEALRKQAEAADQRWKVLQGMINKKDEELDTMRELLAGMQQPQHKPEPEPQTVANQITDADIDEYGKDMIEMVSRASADVVNSRFQEMMKSIESRIAGLENNIGSVAETTRRVSQNSFETQMSDLVPNWREVNVDPNFIGWLDAVDPFTGMTKMDLLTQAARSEDANRAAVFFNTYLNETAPPQQGAVAQPSKSSRKEKLVAPGKANTATAGASEGKRTWTPAEISKLYDDKMAGRITAKKFSELERDIFKAQSEGRIAV